MFAAWANADELSGPGIWVSGFTGQSTVLRVGDLRPEDRLDGGGAGGLVLAFRSFCQLDLCYAYGASATDFSNGVQAGRLRDEHRGGRIFVDRSFWGGERGSAFGGLGFEYRDLKSSLEGAAADQDIRGVDRSAALRIGYQGTLTDHLWLRLWASESVHRGESTDPISRFRYTWTRGGSGASLDLVWFWKERTKGGDPEK
jgi:hypothetical protein